MNFYEVKVEYTSQTGDYSTKSVKESYMTDNVDFGAAESVVHTYLKKLAADKVETLSMKILKVFNTFQLEAEKDHIYCGKVKFITIDDNGTEKSVTSRVYVGANTLTDAKEYLQEQYRDCDADLIGIEETKMLKYINPANV